MKRLFTLLAFVSIFATSFAQNTTTADKEFETAIQYLNNEDYTNTFKHMLISANLGSAKGQWGLGICYIEGKGTTQNLTEGIKYIRKAAEQGYSDAKVYLGLCYLEGKGVPQRNDQAFYWFYEAANSDLKNAEAQLYTAECYKKGLGVVARNDLAKVYYRRAADLGNIDAIFNLGNLYYKSQDYHRHCTLDIVAIADMRTLLGGNIRNKKECFESIECRCKETQLTALHKGRLDIIN